MKVTLKRSGRRIAFACLFLFSAELFGQDSIFVFPSQREVGISVMCVVERRDNDFSYMYKIRSSQESKQNVESFDVEYISSVYDVSVPSGWLGDVSNVKKKVVMWASRDSIFDIMPNNGLEGFAFRTSGLPTIVNFYTRGVVKEPSFPEGEAPPLELTVGLDIFENSKSGKTIGPAQPFEPLNSLVFLDTLISYKHQAFALGWIKNQGIVTSLDQKLDNARRQLERGNTRAAKNMLQAFVNEVEALNKQGKQLTSEAYALLKFNAEFLISKL